MGYTINKITASPLMTEEELEVFETQNQRVQLVKFDDSACYDVESKDFKLEALLNFIGGENTLSSIAISKITNTRHDHVIAKIEKVLTDENLVHPNFRANYKALNGKTSKCYVLPQDLALTVLTSYSTKISMIIMKRWIDVETGKAQPAYIEQAQDNDDPFALIIQMAQASQQLRVEFKELSNKVNQVKSEVKQELQFVNNKLDLAQSLKEQTPFGWISIHEGHKRYCNIVSYEAFKEFVYARNITMKPIVYTPANTVVRVDTYILRIDDIKQLQYHIIRGARKISKCFYEHDDILNKFRLKI